MLQLLMLTVLPLLAESKTVRDPLFPVDCGNVFTNESLQSGVYTIYPAGTDQPVQVYCEKSCDDNNKEDTEIWTVILKRIDGSVNFYRTWQEYQNGFGNLSGEYWLGLQNLYIITNLEKYELRVDLEDFDSSTAYAKYTYFTVDSEANRYALHTGSYINGGAGDAMSNLNGLGFTTFDNYTCGDTFYGGFWYTCSWWYYWYWQSCNPTGLYKFGVPVYSSTGMYWQTWKGSQIALKSIVMKIRQVSVDELQV
ncbi:microfibril-associated glycoprotein 4-like [Hoplias malabaricus]|uniref:microfibril-associated glycoprotein 4-like n=1 Tax=Hoplias malabaricus TaxID=27720 RepID=UPI00346272F8